MPNVTSFSSPDKVPENQCYCHQKPCLPSGLLDISGCEPDSPIYLSWPHFLHGDPYLRKLVQGLAPDEQAHSFILDVLPVKSLIKNGANLIVRLGGCTITLKGKKKNSKTVDFSL